MCVKCDNHGVVTDTEDGLQYYCDCEEAKSLAASVAGLKEITLVPGEPGYELWKDCDAKPGCQKCDGSGIVPGPEDTFGLEEFCDCKEGEKLGAELAGVHPAGSFGFTSRDLEYEEWSARVDARLRYTRETEEAPW